jgi:hypothetical protein
LYNNKIDVIGNLRKCSNINKINLQHKILDIRPAPKVLVHLRFAQMKWRLFEPPRGRKAAASIAQSAIEAS